MNQKRFDVFYYNISKFAHYGQNIVFLYNHIFYKQEAGLPWVLPLSGTLARFSVKF